VFLSRPLSSCGQGGNQTSMSVIDPVAFCSPGKLGSRKNREKVIEQIRDYTLMKLGAPTVRIELTDQQVRAAIDYVLLTLEAYLSNEYYTYYSFNTVAGQSVYNLPPDVGYVREVAYRQQPDMFWNGTEIGGVLPIEYALGAIGGGYGAGGGFVDPRQPLYGKAGEWTLWKQYSQTFSRLSSQIGGWEIIDQCRLKLFPTPCGGNCSRVSVHYVQLNTDYKRVQPVMFDGAYAELLIMLGNVRGKYTTIPGPQGGVQLDGQYLRDKGEQLKEKWLLDLINRYGDGPQSPITMD
jgi:hypothetical protein